MCSGIGSSGDVSGSCSCSWMVGVVVVDNVQ